MSVNSAAVKEYLLELQELIVERLEQVDGKSFLRDKWTRESGGAGIGAGGGISCILKKAM
jgi:coproporphyrinogen III oxidase